MLTTAYIVNQGDVICTASSVVGLTVTVQSEGICGVLDRVNGGLRSTVETQEGFHSVDWISLGHGETELLLNKTNLLDALMRIQDLYRRVQFASHIYTLSTFLQEINWDSSDPNPLSLEHVWKALLAPKRRLGLLNKTAVEVSVLQLRTKATYSIAVLPTPSHHLAVFRTKFLSISATKIHKKAICLRAFCPEDQPLLDRKHVLYLEGGSKCGEIQKDKEWSDRLRGLGCAHVLEMVRIDFSGIFSSSEEERKKAAFLTKYCSGKDLFQYIQGRYLNGMLDPKYTKEHLAIALQIAEILAQFHGFGVVFSDAKLGNFLIQKQEPWPSVFITDFGLTDKEGTISECPPGTYPPPEAQRKMELLDRKEVELIPLCPTEEEEAQFRILTPAVDKWAYGLLLYRLFYEDLKVDSKMSYLSGEKVLLQERDRILSCLSKMGVVEQLVFKLLSLNVAERPPLADVAKELRVLLQ